MNLPLYVLPKEAFQSSRRFSFIRAFYGNADFFSLLDRKLHNREKLF